MPNPANSSVSDIGPVPDPSVQEAVPRSPKDSAASQPRKDGALGPRTVFPDIAKPVIESSEELPSEPAPLLSDKQPQEALAHQKEVDASHPADKSWPETDFSKPRDEVEAAIAECMKTKYGATLVSDMEDAQILLSYVTRNGLQEDRKVSDTTIQTLITARQRLRKGVFDVEKEEGQFRKDYGIIARAAAPVTVASLRDSLMTRPQRRWFFFTETEPRSIADRTCFKYRNYAMWVLILLLISQIYWTIASSVLQKTDALISEVNKAPTRTAYLAQEAARQNALKLATQARAESAAAKNNPPQTTAPQTNPPPAVVTEPVVDKSQLTLDELVSKLAEIDANYSMLHELMKPVVWFFPQTAMAFKSFQPAQKNDKKQQEEDPARDPNDIFDPSSFQTHSATIRAVAGQVIDVMQKWLLPLLYGALGAMVFVVRTLSLQARDRLFRKEALVSLVLRVYLGMISGLAIGWFWNQSPSTSTTGGPLSISTLSPFALAFVAGYGVELFFTLLDKIVSTFTNKP
jgi:hypothetical protein